MEGASAAVAVANPVFAQSFTFYQEVRAIYASYEQTFGKLALEPQSSNNTMIAHVPPQDGPVN